MKTFKDILKEISDIQEGLSLNKDNKVEHDYRSKEFAKEYVKAKKGMYKSMSPSKEDDNNALKFHDKFKEEMVRVGFGGSGEMKYTNRKTGEVYRVIKTGTGKNFYNTLHTITKE